MQEFRKTNDTVFELRTYRTGGGDWNWEVVQSPLEGTEQPKINGIGKLTRWEEKDAFADGQRHLERLMRGEV